MSAQIEVSETVDSDELAAVEAGVAAYGRSKAVGGNARPVAAVGRESCRLVGGAIGRTEYGRLFVNALWVAPDARGRGLGTRLLESLEAEAARRGCADALLDTLLAENVAFCLARGYRVVAVVSNYVGPFDRTILVNTLVRAQESSAA
jgi:GNAT superfamily N-acetyltransferase